MVAVGASFAGVMLMVAVSCAVSPGPPPVLPLSLIASVKVTVADGKSSVSVYWTTEVASLSSSALICATVPVMVTEDVPLPATPAPLPPAATVSVPSVTDRVTVMLPRLPSLASLTARPLVFRLSVMFSVAL